MPNVRNDKKYIVVAHDGTEILPGATKNVDTTKAHNAALIANGELTVLDGVAAPADRSAGAIYVSDGAPDNAVGSNGEFWVQPTTSSFFKKIAGAWTAQGGSSMLTWVAWPLNSKWRSYPAVTGDATFEEPAYAISGNYVFIKGVFDLQNVAGAGDLGAALPAEARPAHKQRIVCSVPAGLRPYDMRADGTIQDPVGGAPVIAFMVITGGYPLT